MEIFQSQNIMSNTLLMMLCYEIGQECGQGLTVSTYAVVVGTSAWADYVVKWFVKRPYKCWHIISTG
jgi:hypothetical protein